MSLTDGPGKRTFRSVPRATSIAARLLFSAYKDVISPIVHTVSPSRCLYLPTCSEYAYLAVARHGAVRGGWLAFRRFLRCHPFAKGGLDPVPLDPMQP